MLCFLLPLWQRTPHRPQIGPRSTTGCPQIDPRSTPKGHQVDPRSTPAQPQIDPRRTPARPMNGPSTTPDRPQLDPKKTRDGLQTLDRPQPDLQTSTSTTVIGCGDPMGAGDWRERPNRLRRSRALRRPHGRRRPDGFRRPHGFRPCYGLRPSHGLCCCDPWGCGVAAIDSMCCGDSMGCCGSMSFRRTHRSNWRRLDESVDRVGREVWAVLEMAGLRGRRADACPVRRWMASGRGARAPRSEGPR